MRRPSESRDLGGARRRLGAGRSSSAAPKTPPEPLQAVRPELDLPDEEGAGEKDMRLGQILLENKACSPEQIEQCLKIQEDLGALGAEAVPKLGELLVRKG